MGKSVTVIHRRDKFRASKVLADEYFHIPRSLYAGTPRLWRLRGNDSGYCPTGWLWRWMQTARLSRKT